LSFAFLRRFAVVDDFEEQVTAYEEKVAWGQGAVPLVMRVIRQVGDDERGLHSLSSAQQRRPTLCAHLAPGVSGTER